MLSGFHEELREAFEEPRASKLPQHTTATSRPIDDGYTEVDAFDLDSASILTPATTERYAPRARAADVLPNVHMLERPEDLMRKPPYHLILSHTQYGKFITIQCSHQPSLELISEYFKKWTKRNHNQTTRVSKGLLDWDQALTENPASGSRDKDERVVLRSRTAI
jgi:hypothetical protein